MVKKNIKCNRELAGKNNEENQVIIKWYHVDDEMSRRDTIRKQIKHHKINGPFVIQTTVSRTC